MTTTPNLGSATPDWERIASIDSFPCGCVNTTHRDGSTHWQPCVPCALIHCGTILHDLGNRLAEKRERGDD